MRYTEMLFSSVTFQGCVNGVLGHYGVTSPKCDSKKNALVKLLNIFNSFELKRNVPWHSEMAQMLSVLAAVIEDLGLIHSSTWWHITVCHSSAGELDALH